ncbi:(Z)-2-((N-methylformamido)methylene)-5-hydroxybutyrolactone dehydrogenase [Cochliomyia hominivorax]
MSSVSVTQELFNKMSYDSQTSNLKGKATGDNVGIADPSVLVVFANSDINAALYHLNKSLETPFAAKTLATVLIQESIKEDFIEKLQNQIKSFNVDNQQTNENFNKALATAKKLNAKLITGNPAQENFYQPTFVCDFSHEQLGVITKPSGIVTLHTFRTAKEAVTLINKETLKFTSVSIWHENHGYAYELVSLLKSPIFFINCYQVSLSVLEESVKANKNYVCLDKSYHYETLQHDGVQKSIVFPIGSIFAN